MLVGESLDHLKVTTGTLKGERGVSSLIHCNCTYNKQIVDAKTIVKVSSYTHILGHTDVFEQDIW